MIADIQLTTNGQNEATRENITVPEEILSSKFDKSQLRPRQLPQYIASLTVTSGAFAIGFVNGWTSPAGKDGINLQYSFPIDPEEFSWISSMLPVGGALACLPAGILNNLIGRRRAMLSLAIPFIIGWACLIWPNSPTTLIIGRLILGVNNGVYFVIAPIYIAEISDSETRGRISSYIQLFFYMGILGSNALGLLRNMFMLSSISAGVSIITIFIFLFIHETPTYNLKRGNVEAARKTLIWLRGTSYDVEFELEEKMKGMNAAECNEGSFFVAITSRAVQKGLLIANGLVFFQRFSGVDAIYFYDSGIFADATGNDGNLSAVGVIAVQIVTVLLLSFAIDKWGRRLLLLISGSVMCLSTLILGVYFYFHENNTSMDYFEWVPLVCITCFLSFYSFGYGSVPSVMLGELFSPQIKAVAASSVTMASAIMVFAVTKFYSEGREKIGPYGIFWTYSAISGIGNVFVYFVVPETKRKTLEQIQIELNGKVD